MNSNIFSLKKRISKVVRGRIVLALILAVCMTMTACAGKIGMSGDAEKADNEVKIYYVNSSETGIVADDYTLTSDIKDTDAVIAELIEQLSQNPDTFSYEAPLAGRIALIDYKLTDDSLILNFNESYNSVDHVTEILDRAAMVRTLTQIDAVKTVTFQVGGSPLTDVSGNVIGTMTEDTFIYNAGNEINTYEKVILTLYFTNESGDGLIKVYRTVVFNSNISMERIALEQLIAGPNTDEVYPTINPATSINSITVRDGICYVDLDSAFTTEPYTVTAQTAIYSIVNTLCEFTEVNKVQITVDGNKDVKFMDSLSLSSTYERNLEIIEE
ncbi:GerMN domain-containing protein [Butyrivibrio sp. TB]|uniref:GerMN domain-containing protein n=1 Tax=Butyrivibrio sp. TB TaxID=1520809 RepID=UPI0008D36DBA|nr:GerMN domain-containing protein [Butyrivibrio sp. TB]SEQ48293.1 germination protein M [Butyrivibrio sp. TB]